MLKFIILSIIASAANALVPIYGQCGGNLWTGDKQCAPGLTCQVQNEWYHQCLPGGGGGVTTQPTQPTQPPGPLPELPSGFPGKNLKIGISWDGVFLNDNDATFKKYDYISIWINSPWGDNPSNTDFNPYWTGTMIEKCLSLGKTPLFYAYVIAFEARAKFGYQDCDVHPTNNLCYYGAKFIKENRNLLVSRYTHQAKSIAAALKNRNAECIFVIEPDFWQYYGDHHTQQGGTLSGEYMRELYDDFARAIRAELPNAKLSWDLSAWIGEAGMTTWWGYFKTSPYIDFVHTSGGQGQAGSSSYKPGELAWSAFSRITGKRIIADCGYGIGGGSSGNCGAWNKDNTQARIYDGVVALSAAQGASQNPPSLERLSLP